MTLDSLRKVGLTNEAISAALAKESWRPAPSRQRVQDWVSGLRPVPKWAEQAAAALLCRMWETERQQMVPRENVPRCDARWAALIDPILGELYAVLLTVPRDVAAHLRPLKARIRNEVARRLSIELPGV